MHMCTCAYTCIHVYTHTYEYIYTHTHMNIYRYSAWCTCVHVHTRIYMYTHTHMNISTKGTCKWPRYFSSEAFQKRNDEKRPTQKTHVTTKRPMFSHLKSDVNDLSADASIYIGSVYVHWHCQMIGLFCKRALENRWHCLCTPEVFCRRWQMSLVMMDPHQLHHLVWGGYD